MHALPHPPTEVNHWHHCRCPCQRIHIHSHCRDAHRPPAAATLIHTRTECSGMFRADLTSLHIVFNKCPVQYILHDSDLTTTSTAVLIALATQYTCTYSFSQHAFLYKCISINNNIHILTVRKRFSKLDPFRVVTGGEHCNFFNI
jgi:hypothetical protein